MTVLSRLLLVFFSLLGMADAAYITYEEFAGVVPYCLPIANFDCGLVLSSAWSHVGPIPLSLLGVGFYATVFVLACYSFVVAKPHPWTRSLLALLGTSGFLVSAYLIYVQAVILEAFCMYCLVSAITSTAIFVTSLWHRHLTKTEL